MRVSKQKMLISLLLMVLLGLTGGCTQNWQSLLTPSEPEVQPLIYVEISFSDSDHIVGYVKTLGIEKDTRIFVGGSSVNYVYDINGNPVAAFNYARANYIKIIPEPTVQNQQ